MLIKTSYKEKLAKFFPILILLLLVLLINFGIPTQAKADNLSEGETISQLEEEKHSLTTYPLTVLSQGSRQSVKIDPPALKMTVTVNSGESAIRCGDDFRSYSCVLGKPLELSYETTEPNSKFWAENNTEHQVKLMIKVEEIFMSDNENEIDGEASK